MVSSPLFDVGYVSALYSGKGSRTMAALRAYARRIFAARSVTRDVEAVIVEKELLPWVPWWFERWLWSWRVPCVVDYDDAIYATYAGRPFLKGKIASVMAAANAVVCGSEELVREASRHNNRVIHIPTTVDVKTYRVIRRDGGGGRLGWVGTPVTDRYLDLVLPALDAVNMRQTIEVVLVGASQRPALRDRPYIRIVPWSEAVEKDLGALFDIGIMPLYDDPFSRGKCAFKIIQYGACGLPTIASPVGANREVIIAGETGLLARDIEEWMRAVERLLNDPALQERMGRAARERVEKHYDIHIAIERWQELLTGMAAGWVRAAGYNRR